MSTGLDDSNPGDGTGGADAASRGGRSTGIDHGELYDLLSNRRRRFAIHYLMQRPGERMEMSELSEQVAGWEHDVDPESLSYEQRKTVHTSLYQHHAPRLDEAGLVEYDPSRGTVRLTETGREIDLYLEAVTGYGFPWATYFLLLSALGTAVIAAAWVGTLPAEVSDIAWGGVVAVGTLVSSLAFAYDTYSRMRLGSEGTPPEVATTDGGQGTRKPP